MTFDEIVSDVAGRVNVTQASGITRIGTHVNRRYRRVTSSIGLIDFRRTQILFPVTTLTRTQTITGIEKVISVVNASVSNGTPLDEITYEEMLEVVPTTGGPSCYAVKRLGASSVVLVFDSTFAAATNLSVEGEEIASTLSGSQIPAFSESYHDVLVFGALADEQRKMEKISLARDSDMEYERILSEMRLHIAVSGFKDVVQGKRNIAHIPASFATGAGGGSTSDLFDNLPFWNVLDSGAVGDGVHDDTAAITAAIALGRPVWFPSGTYLVSSLLTFNVANMTYWGDGATLLYGFAQTGWASTGHLMTLTASRLQFRGLTFSGNGRQVDTSLIYIGDNVVRPQFHNCRVTNIVGVHLAGQTNSSSNNQYGVQISPYGVREFLFEGCEFDTISNRNNNVGVAHLSGLGFAGAMLIGIRDTMAEPTDPQPIPTDGVIHACSFRDILTVLENGLSVADQTSYDDGDAIRFYGNIAGATQIWCNIEACHFTNISKRAVKGSVSNFCTVRDCTVEGSGGAYPMVTGMKLETGWTVEGCSFITTSAKPFQKVFQIHDVNNLRVSNIYASHCDQFLDIAPTATNITTANMRFTDIVCDYVTSAGINFSTQYASVTNAVFERIKFTASPANHTMIGFISPTGASTDDNQVRVRGLEIVNGEVKCSGSGNIVEDVNVVLSDILFTGSAASRSLVELGAPPGFTTSAAPTAADSGVAGTVSGQRWYRVRYAIPASLRYGDWSPALAFTPSTSKNAVVVTKPAALSAGETHWELAAAGAATGPFYKIASTVVGTTTVNDSISGAPPSYSATGTLIGIYRNSQYRNIQIRVDAAPTGYLNGTRTQLAIFTGDRSHYNGIKIQVTPDLVTTQAHLTIYGHHMVVENVDYWGTGFVEWMHNNVFEKWKGSLLRNASRLGGDASTVAFVKSRFAAKTSVFNLVDYCTGSAAIFDNTTAVGGQEYNLLGAVTQSTADPIFIGLGITGGVGVGRSGNSTTLLLVDGITAPTTQVGEGIIYIDTADGDLKIKFSDGTTKTIVIDT